MFGIGDTELLLIAIFAFLLFGPDKLPELGKTLSKGLKQVKQAQDSVTSVVQKQMMDPMQEAVDDVNNSLNTGAPSEKPHEARAETSTFAEQKSAANKKRMSAQELYQLDTSVPSKTHSEKDAPDA